MSRFQLHDNERIAFEWAHEQALKLEGQVEYISDRITAHEYWEEFVPDYLWKELDYLQRRHDEALALENERRAIVQALDAQWGTAA